MCINDGTVASSVLARCKVYLYLLSLRLRDYLTSLAFYSNSHFVSVGLISVLLPWEFANELELALNRVDQGFHAELRIKQCSAECIYRSTLVSSSAWAPFVLPNVFSAWTCLNCFGAVFSIYEIKKMYLSCPDLC